MWLGEKGGRMITLTWILMDLCSESSRCFGRGGRFFPLASFISIVAVRMLLSLPFILLFKRIRPFLFCLLALARSPGNRVHRSYKAINPGFLKWPFASSCGGLTRSDFVLPVTE